MKRKQWITGSILVGILFLIMPDTAYAMHIMEGFLPVKWAVFWTLASLPFLVWGFISISAKLKDPQLKLLFGLTGAFAFVLSALKIPSVTGSSSHPTGVGLGAVLFGPASMSVIGFIVLLFQTLLLAHGGLTTLGANVFSMAVAGPFAAYAVYLATKKAGLGTGPAIFLAAAAGNLATYLTTSMQLALAFPAETGGFLAAAAKFTGIFAVTQIPLAFSEGLLTVIIFNYLVKFSQYELNLLNINAKGVNGNAEI